MTLVARSLPGSIMADHRSTPYELNEMSTSARGSYRSRASSVISTGTKFSISTMPHGFNSIDDMVEGSYSSDATVRPRSVYNINGLIDGSNSVNARTRPASLYSAQSIATSLPPYEGHAPLDSFTQTATGRDNELEQSFTLDTENAHALSRHYGRIVRTIDENHMRQLERINRSHKQELDETREAIDRAYRAEYMLVRGEAAATIAAESKRKDKEFVHYQEEALAKIANLKAEIGALKESYDEEVAVLKREAADRALEMRETYNKDTEKACHTIEDMWEVRWNDRTRLAIEENHRRDRARDQEWLSVLQAKHPEYVNEMKEAIELTRATSRQSD